MIELPLGVEKVLASPSSINYRSFLVDNEAEEYTVNVPGYVLARALDYDHTASDSVVKNSVKLWAKIFYDKAAPNSYKILRMQASTRILEPRRVYIDKEDVHISCEEYAWERGQTLHFENVNGRNFDEYTGFTRFVEPNPESQIGGVVTAYIKHYGNGNRVMLSLPLTIAGPQIYTPSGGK